MQEKNKFQIFIFRVMVIIVHFFSMKFRDSSKNINRRIFLLFFPFYSANSASFIKFPPFLRRGGGQHILNCDMAYLFKCPLLRQGERGLGGGSACRPMGQGRTMYGPARTCIYIYLLLIDMNCQTHKHILQNSYTVEEYTIDG